MHKISVIVTVYNNAKFLDQCLRSIIQQSYQNLEILLINDGSKDGSLKVCEKYQENDPRIRLISQKHQGASAARNKGIDLATGEYLYIVNSDDQLNRECLKHMVDILSINQADIAIAFFRVWSAQDHKYYASNGLASYDSSLNGTYNPRQWFQVCSKYSKKLVIVPHVMRGKLFKRELFNNVRLPVDWSIGEDAAVLWQLYLKADRIVFRNNLDYIYTNFKSEVLQNKFDLQDNQRKVDQQEITLFRVLGFSATAATIQNYWENLNQDDDQRIVAHYGIKTDK